MELEREHLNSDEKLVEEELQNVNLTLPAENSFFRRRRNREIGRSVSCKKLDHCEHKFESISFGNCEIDSF
uniref:Uncharacterized protein n=1 Tax=Onchocerca volvulus TaxID=6282 RepID=A0A2K6WA57_ONCVO